VCVCVCVCDRESERDVKWLQRASGIRQCAPREMVLYVCGYCVSGITYQPKPQPQNHHKLQTHTKTSNTDSKGNRYSI